MASSSELQSLILKASEGIASKIASSKDLILCNAVNTRLGRGWLPADLVGRMFRQFPPDGSEIYYLDGKPLVKFFPQTLESTVETFKTSINYHVF
jgi:hypothetical protein